MYEAHLQGDAIATRSRAYVLTLYSLGARHDDVAHVLVDHPRYPLRAVPDGYRIWITETKTDKTSGGYDGLIPHRHDELDRVLCPACALDEYLQLWQISRGPLFQGTEQRRGTKNIDPTGWDPRVQRDPDGRPLPLTWNAASKSLQMYAATAGLTEEGLRIATHSFKPGYVTDEYRAGRALDAIADDVHTSADVVNRFYLRLDNPDQDFAGFEPGMGSLGGADSNPGNR